MSIPRTSLDSFNLGKTLKESRVTIRNPSAESLLQSCVDPETTLIRPKDLYTVVSRAAAVKRDSRLDDFDKNY